MLKSIEVKNFKSIKDSGVVEFNSNLFTIAGQNEAGKSSFLEALKTFEEEDFDIDTLNFLEERDGNKIQTISCTYIIDSDFWVRFDNKVKEEYSKNEIEGKLFNIEELSKKIKEIKITKKFNHNEDKLETSIDDNIFNVLKTNILTIEIATKDENDQDVKIEDAVINIDDDLEKIAGILFSTTPLMILFNDFSDILPDKIKVSDLENDNKEAEGYNAVRNLESLLGRDFVSISKLNNAQKISQTNVETDTVSTEFQKDFSQKINGESSVKIGFNIENENVNGQAINTVFFHIVTKDFELLPPRKRSKGMIWFVSIWLDFKAKSKAYEDIKLIILYDEPGQYLHIRAHKDILSIFNDLVSKGHQIIFSTHSPSLIDTNKLNSLGLVINDNKKGSFIESVFSKIKTDNQQDALQPISEAIGMDPIKDFGVIHQNNVLVEGLSDFYYLSSMKKILNIDSDFGIIPLLGIKGAKTNNLISMCVGYNLNWVCIFDGGDIPISIKEEVQEKVFLGNKDGVNKHVFLHNEKEIEDIFSIEDLQLVNPRIMKIKNKSNIELIGNKNKIIFAKEFSLKVDSGNVNKNNLSQASKEGFKKFFNFIEKQFNSIEDDKNHNNPVEKIFKTNII